MLSGGNLIIAREDARTFGYPTPWRLRLVFTVWLALVLLATAWLWKYKLTSARTPDPEPRWPMGSALATDPSRPTLVLLAHPRCPCTRASLSELRKVLGTFGDRVSAYVLFFQPSRSGGDWSRTASWDLARSIPGVQVRTDVEGREAARFGATTSGHVLLYSQSGALLFSGGITPARGHEGDNLGERLLVERLRVATTTQGGEVPRARATDAVFGCSLRDKPPQAGP